MTVRYNYECPVCEHTYIEQRLATEPRYIIMCNSCKKGEYIEKSKLNLYVTELSSYIQNQESDVVVFAKNYCVWLKSRVVVGGTPFNNGTDDAAAAKIARTEGYDRYVWLNDRPVPNLGDTYDLATDTFTSPN